MAAFALLLRGALEVWPLRLLGVRSRAITLPLFGVLGLSRGQGWRRLPSRGKGWQILAMGIISILINLLIFTSLEYTTGTNHALLLGLALAR